MNIGVDIRCLMSPIRTGVAEYTFGILNALLELDSNNNYYLFYNSYEDVTKNIPIFSQNNVRYLNYKWPNKIFNICTKTLAKPKIDEIIKHKFSLQNLDWFFSPNPNFLSLSKKTKHLLTMHDLSYEFFPEFFNKKQRLWHYLINPKRECQKANLIITPSQNTKNDIVDYYKISSEKIKVIYPGNNCTASQTSAELNLPKKYILYLGTLEERKNVLGLIEAFELIADELPDYNLLIAGGDGFGAEKIYNRLENLKSRQNIKILGYISEKDKPSLYKNADLFVYPSFYEGFGFPVIESMLLGTPVICSNRSSLNETGGKAAYYVDPNNIADIAKGVTAILKNEQVRNYHIIAGYKQAEKFQWKTAAAELLNLLQ